MADTRARVESVLMGGHDLLHDPDSWLAKIEKIRAQPTEDSSNQGTFLGRREHLFDYDEVAKLKDFNVHHSTCLEAKISTAFGLGHRNPRIHEVLDPLCEVSWQTTLDALGSDFFEFANAYLEVVRDEAGQIIKLFHLPAKDVWVYVEEHSNQYHYEIAARGNLMMAENLSGLRWARFGERDEFISRRNIATDMRKRVSEVIHFPMNLGRRSRHYGYPDWIPATPAMELDQCVTQYAFDFFFNGGMPEAIYTVAGQRMDPDDWEAIKKAFREHQGLGNRRKTMLINLAGTEIKAQLDKLTLDGQTTGENQKLVDDQALKIVSAHRVPPLLAGIQIPGKLGAANEMSNAIMAFQSLVISKVQKHFSTILATSLGDPEYGIEGLTPQDFRGEGVEGDVVPDQMQPPDPMTGMLPTKPADHRGNGFHTVVEEIDIALLETVSRMRTSVPEAQARGRDMSQGLAERGGEIDNGGQGAA
jgi:hypothetical protein